jgi:hypothetical protein
LKETLKKKKREKKKTYTLNLTGPFEDDEGSAFISLLQFEFEVRNQSNKAKQPCELYCKLPDHQDRNYSRLVYVTFNDNLGQPQI